MKHKDFYSESIHATKGLRKKQTVVTIPYHFPTEIWDKVSNGQRSNHWLSVREWDMSYLYVCKHIEAGNYLSIKKIGEIVASHSTITEWLLFGLHRNLRNQHPIDPAGLKSGTDISAEDLKKVVTQDVRFKMAELASFKQWLLLNRLPKARTKGRLRKLPRNMADTRGYSIRSMAIIYEIKHTYKSNDIEILKQQAT